MNLKDDCYNVDLIDGNVFLSGKVLYYVYKINLITNSFKALVSFYVEDEEYWDNGLCDWFELSVLKDSKLIGYIPHCEESNKMFYKILETNPFINNPANLIE